MMLATAFVPSRWLGAQQAVFNEANRRLEETHASPPRPPTQPAAPTGQYVCPNCGATLGDRADVSPLGDVKCPFCGSWFNIHGRRAS
jgi:DNA-directed RNA polymerase subunit RPC12/RpoP